MYPKAMNPTALHKKLIVDVIVMTTVLAVDLGVLAKDITEDAADKVV
jgi:hypothetical protein